MMDLSSLNSFVELVHITPLYAGLFGLLLIPMTLAVVAQRFKAHVSLLDGGDKTLIKRIRAHGNFVEYVPFGLTLLLLAELSGAGDVFLYTIASIFLLARTAHYISINVTQLFMLRRVSMVVTLLYFLVVSGWLVYASIAG